MSVKRYAEDFFQAESSLTGGMPHAPESIEPPAKKHCPSIGSGSYPNVSSALPSHYCVSEWHVPADGDDNNVTGRTVITGISVQDARPAHSQEPDTVRPEPSDRFVPEQPQQLQEQPQLPVRQCILSDTRLEQLRVVASDHNYITNGPGHIQCHGVRDEPQNVRPFCRSVDSSDSNEVDVVGLDPDSNFCESDGQSPGYQKVASHVSCCISDEKDSGSSGLQSDDADSLSSGASDAPTASSSSSSSMSVTTKSLLMRDPGLRRGKKSVNFTGVTVYYFPRSQGFTCVPSQGGSTLGMDTRHMHLRNFSLEGHAEEKKKLHKEIIIRQRRFAKLYHKQHSTASTSESDDVSDDDISDISDSEVELDSCYFLQVTFFFPADFLIPPQKLTCSFLLLSPSLCVSAGRCCGHRV
jgi:hypothetical protein